MKVATWNINSVRVRVEQLAEVLREDQIDVIFLQEIKCVNEAFPTEYFEDLGYNCAVFGQRTYNGVAILSKMLIEDIKFGSEAFYMANEARYIEALISGHKMASVYIPNGQDVSFPAYEFKLSFLSNLKEYLAKEIVTESFVLGGDFNIARNDLDVYNPKLWKGRVCCTERERDKFEDLLKLGLNDRHREISGNEAVYTWWDYRQSGFSKNHGLRLDYILTTQNITVKNCYVDLKTRGKERPSDHAPLVMEIA